MLLTRDTLPDTIADIAALDDLLCRPSQALIDDLAKVEGDIMILGVAGKMGPTLAGLAKAALPDRRIVGEFIASERGLGYLMIQVQSSLDTPAMVMAVVLLTLLGVALYGLVLGLERLFVVRDIRLQ